MSEVEIKEYRSSTGRYEGTDVRYSAHTLARSMSVENLAQVLLDFVNCNEPHRAGKELGKELVYGHRTLQANLVHFFLKAIYVISRQGHTDARNSFEVQLCRKIVEVLTENDVYYFGPE